MTDFNCYLCPRRCGVKRPHLRGFCNVDVTRVANYSLHMWEEPFISGQSGSGTIFFCGCNMRCVFCQNSDISTNAENGRAINSAAELVQIMHELECLGASNINFVTPEPHILLIRDAIRSAKEGGLSIPIVLNTNSYMSVPAVKSLSGLVDIYLPDIKYVSSQLSQMFSATDDYFTHASAAIAEMYSQVGKLKIDPTSGLAVSGVALRHLVLPGNIPETRAVLEYIQQSFPPDMHVSLMAQYFPTYRAKDYPPLDRVLLRKEYMRAVEYAIALGLTNVLVQELHSATDSFVPKWNQ